MAHDIFISYAREDRERVQSLVAAFEQRGWSVLWDKDIRTGEQWRSWIARAIADARCVVVVWSRHSVGSHWVADEADEAARQGRPVFPVLFDAVAPPLGFRGIQAADLGAWKAGHDSPAAARLFQDIGEKLGAAPPDRPPLPPPVRPSGRRAVLGAAAVAGTALAAVVAWRLLRQPTEDIRPPPPRPAPTITPPIAEGTDAAPFKEPGPTDVSIVKTARGDEQPPHLIPANHSKPPRCSDDVTRALMARLQLAGPNVEANAHAVKVRFVVDHGQVAEVIVPSGNDLGDVAAHQLRGLRVDAAARCAAELTWTR